MAELRLEKVTKSFAHGPSAVSQLSLEIPSGECLALLGPSGAGKSTVLRLIAGLETVTSGAVFLEGRSLDRSSAGERAVAMAFQNPALLPHLTVAENLALGPKLRRVKSANDIIQSISDRLGLKPLLNRRPETLSGGEQQRVALGRALVARPKVLLLDEPLASLDPLARVELRDVIHRVQTELKLTTIYVTHDQNEAAAVADRIGLLREGTLQQVGTATDLYWNPSNLFVARFFGADGLNTISAAVTPQGSRSFVGLDGFGLTVQPTRPLHRAVLAFRPSAVNMLKASNDGWLVKERRDLGWTSILTLQKGENEIRALASHSTSAEIGEHVNVAVDSTRLLAFHPESGERLR